MCHRHHGKDGFGGDGPVHPEVFERIARRRSADCFPHLYNEIDLLLFFRDPLTPKPHEPNEMNLLRLCDMHNIPLATNIATAEVLIHGLERGDLDWRNIVNPKRY